MSEELLPPLSLSLLETRAKGARAKHATARKQAEDNRLGGVGHEEVEDTCFARQDDFAHALILRLPLKFRDVPPALGEMGQSGGQGQQLLNRLVRIVGQLQ